MGEQKKIIAVFIAYNAAGTLEDFYKLFPTYIVDEIILVDDSSKDNTYDLAKKLGISSYQNETNLGYGGNMKRALRIALEKGADIVIDIHPDGEYSPAAIPGALKEIDLGASFVLGNRFYDTKAPLLSGMRIWKFFPIIVLNKIAKWILGVKIDDLHQGFRVYSRTLLENVNFETNSNGYLFSFEIIAQAAYKKMTISQVPIQTNYTGKKRGASFSNSLQYSIGIFKVLFLYLLAKFFYRPAIFRDRAII
jgi:glycosyltransferase involved in cell wall biosynthesis